MAREMKGHCLCGAVTVTVRGPVSGVWACHCSMCRRWGGAVTMGMDTAPEHVSFEGPVARYRSSSFAERTWCERCGTHLWFRDDGKDYELSPGIFDDARDVPLIREVYIDRAFACVPFAGDHERVTRADYESDKPYLEGL